MAAQLSPVLQESITRCAEALGDVPRLKAEVHQLKATGDALAHFASMLFEVELARRGDAESRQQITQLAEVLLVFWRDGSGTDLARLHPATRQLWETLAPMMQQLEGRQLDVALIKLWKAKNEPNLLISLLAHLSPDGDDRVEFARCLYHLELVRMGIDSSRREFAQRVRLLADAYQDEALARQRVAGDAGLKQLWAEVKPYLDEFFEGLEEQAARTQEPTRKVQMPVRPEVTTPVEVPAAQVPTAEVLAPPTIAPVTMQNDAVTPPGGLPMAMPTLADRPGLGTEREVPSFRTLTRQKLPPPAPKSGEGGPPTLFPTKSPPPQASPAPVPVLPAAPPPPPANLTPPGSWVPEADLVIDEVAEASDPVDEIEIDAVEAPPPPPPAITPVHGVRAAKAPAPPPPSPIEEELDVEAWEAEEVAPDDQTLAFWEYTFASLQAVADGQGRTRMLASESRADRKRLTTWLDGMGPHLAVPEGQAFAALVRLTLAAQTREKSLFGQANPRRKEGLEQAFALLHANPAAAGRAAVWFEIDGYETRESLSQGLELLVAYLGFCARESLDPLQPATVQRYLDA